MNPEIKKRWVEALWGGEYKQGTGCLKEVKEDSPPLYCCLGVLCDLYAREKGVGWESPSDSRHKLALSDNVDILPWEVVEWADLEGPDPQVLDEEDEEHAPYDGETNLSGINDDGASFLEIANLIEENL